MAFIMGVIFFFAWTIMSNSIGAGIGGIITACVFYSLGKRSERLRRFIND
jgi:ABC-type enterobactin transport system permease subunit